MSPNAVSPGRTKRTRHHGDSAPARNQAVSSLRMQLVLLHAFPLDGTMWANEMSLLPNATMAPTLYSVGESIEDWARAVLDLATEKALVLVGNSVGGSCRARSRPPGSGRTKAIVLIGAKAG